MFRHPARPSAPSVTQAISIPAVVLVLQTAAVGGAMKVLTVSRDQTKALMIFTAAILMTGSTDLQVIVHNVLEVQLVHT